MSTHSIQSLLSGVRRVHSLALARSISLLENRPSVGAKLLRGIRRSGHRRSSGLIIGVTGSAGSGKSTLISGLAKLLRRTKKRVAVLAVDPTSPKTGGAFLGDRVRMQELAEDPGIFIRSMASRGVQGGLGRATKPAAILLRDAGFDFVLIETVGAGQLDYAVTKTADLTLLVLTPESGDEMQFMKAGLGEMVDAFIVNKSDRPGAKTLEDFLKRSQGEGKSRLPVYSTVAEQKKGIRAVCAFILNWKRKKRLRRHR